MDVIIFCGQSNMQGSSGETGTILAKNCLEYKYLTDSLVALKDPVGEDVGDGELMPSLYSSLVPAFCNAYAKRKGKTIAIHCAKGNTCIDEWKKGTNRYQAMIEKAKKGIEKVKQTGKVDKVYMVWLQGESDALLRKSEEEYLSSLVEFKNNVKSDIGIYKFGIIRVGYFAEYAYWKPEANKSNDETIMSAQERAVSQDSDFIMLTRVCSKLSVNKKWLNPKEYGPHYNNKAFKIIGRKGGKALSKIK